MLRRFLKFVLPSMMAFTFSGLYAIVDGFFVGQFNGDMGLAAINIAYPITAFIQAVGTGIGMGGAIQIAESRGREDRKQEHRVLGNTISLLILASLLFTIILLFAYRPLLHLFGAQGELFEAASAYIRIIIFGTTFQLLATGFAPILRNYEAALFAMFSMIAGFVGNIVLDAVFVAILDWGVEGAAWATILGQVFTVLPCSIFLLNKACHLTLREYRPEAVMVKHIIRIGLSPFGLTMCPNIVVLLMNKNASIYGGDLAVAAYAIISYINAIVLLLLQGIGDGSQPLLSFYLGSGEKKHAHQVRKMAYYFAIGTALVSCLLIIGLRRQIPEFFGASAESGALAAQVFPLFAIGALFVAVCRITTAFFYSMRENRLAYIMVYGEPAILLILLLVLPLFWKASGIWIATPLTQLLLLIVSMVLLKFHKKRKGEKSLPA